MIKSNRQVDLESSYSLSHLVQFSNEFPAIDYKIRENYFLFSLSETLCALSRSKHSKYVGHDMLE